MSNPLVIKIDFDTREILMQADPETFFITDHYYYAPEARTGLDGQDVSHRTPARA